MASSVDRQTEQQQACDKLIARETQLEGQNTALLVCSHAQVHGTQRHCSLVDGIWQRRTMPQLRQPSFQEQPKDDTIRCPSLALKALNARSTLVFNACDRKIMLSVSKRGPRNAWNLLGRKLMG